jgi:hypothetical protein
MMEEMKFLGGASVLDYQTGFYLAGDNLFVVMSRVFPDGSTEVYHVEKHKLFKEPKDLIDTDDIEYIRWWLGGVLTGSIPTPEQRRNLEIIVNNPDSPVTQAMIDVCMRNDCVCPLALTIGCLDFIRQAVEPRGRGRGWSVVPLQQKKSVQRAISALLRHCSYSELMRWIESLGVGAEEIEKYGGVL